MKKIIQVLPAAIAILFGSASIMAQGMGSTRPIQAEEREILFPSGRMLELGQAVAASTCADCHGLDGVSTVESQPHLAGQRAIYLYRILKEYQNSERGDEDMQRVSRFLNDEALLSVSAYYASLAPARKPAGTVTSVEAEPLEDNPFTGIGTAIKKCTKCHGDTGNSTASGMPNLTAQDPAYFAASMKAYVDGGRNHKMMNRLVGKLDEQTITEMGVYYAVQDPLASETRGDGDEESGRKLAEACATCHGEDGNAGSADMPSLAGQDARYFVKAMGEYLGGDREHQSMFNAVKGLGDSEIQDLAAFYAAQKPLKRDVRVPFTSAEWIERCARCHGANGNSTDPRFPMLAGQNEGYLREAIKSYSAGARLETVMHAMSEPLSEVDIERIVSYYAAQEPKSVLYIPLPCE